MKMKTMLTTMAALLAGSACLAAAPMGTAAKLKANPALVSLADARSRIDKAIAKPAVMKALMQHLSAEDQKAFLAEVNAAIAAMPASDEERVAIFVAVNRAALEGARRGNVAALVAESFATVQPVALPALSESLSADLINRATDKGRTYTDAEYLQICSTLMTRVNARTAEADHGDVRSAFAALMLIRGSNAAKPETVAAVVATLPESVRATAQKEWFPAALAEGAAKSYDAMLAAADVEGYVAPETVVVQGGEAEETKADGQKLPNTNDDYWKAMGGTPLSLRVTGPQLAQSLIFDIVGGNMDGSRLISQATPVYDALQTIDELQPFGGTFVDAPAAIGGITQKETEKVLNPDSDREPGGYPWQRIR